MTARIALFTTLAIAGLLLACEGRDAEGRALERLEAWLTPETRLVLQPAGERVSAELVDDVVDFVALASVATVWPGVLPEGTTLAAAILTFGAPEGPTLEATFFDTDGETLLLWRASTQEVVFSIPPEVVEATSGGAIVERPGVPGLRWTMQASGCGHTILGIVVEASSLTLDDALRAAESWIETCEQ